MDPRFAVNVDDARDARDAALFVGLRGLAQVGATAARHMVAQLEMPLVGGVYSPTLPAVTAVVNGRAAPAVRLHAKHTRGFLGTNTERLLVMLDTAPVADDHVPWFADATVAWAKAAGVRTVVVADGIMTETEAENDGVFAVASNAAALEHARKLDLHVITQGTLVGSTAAFVNAGAQHGVPVLALLAEAAPGYPDAAAAARVLELFDKMTPGINVGAMALKLDAAATEDAVRDATQRVTAARRG